MNFQQYAQHIAPKIQKKVTALLKSEARQSFTNAHLKNLFPLFCDSTKGGKYLRGILVLLGYSLINAEENKNVFTISAAYEIAHSSLLIHDDIVDKSRLRRGSRSVWERAGINQALCLGDLGFFICYQSILKSNFSAEQKVKATSLLSEIVIKTITGEMLDIALSQPALPPQSLTRSGKIKNKERSESDVLQIYQLKTAYYTISGPLMLGALLGGADEKILKKLKLFGYYLGVAFQIQDDILGIFGNEKNLGKSVASDSEENKNTLLITYALQNGTVQQRKALSHLYGKKNLSQQEFREIKKIFETIGALTYSRRKALAYAKKAKKIVPTITKDVQLQNLLTALASYIVEREK